MSASLVGSEMCIRDRGWNGGPAGCASAVVASSSTVLRLRRLRNVEAVSYTHLTLPMICSV
eukprot:12628875-Alexandrium_andersonii.AAC.1